MFLYFHNLLKFKNIIKLLDSKSKHILENIFFVNSFDNNFMIQHTGLFFGTETIISINFDKSWKYKNTFISFKTN